ncbi:hypothetical protein KI387_040704, partial [Taxus chinensis]
RSRKRAQDHRSEQGGGYRTTALKGGGFVTEGQEAKERGKKGEKQRGAGAKRRACG